MWDVAQYERLAHTAIQTLADYVERSQTGQGMVVSAPPLAELMEELDLRRLIRAGGLGEENFERWFATMLAHTTRLHHPGELAHQVAPPDMPSALADLVHGPTNQPMSVYEMGPAAGAMEAAVLEWMTEQVGWEQGAGGVLTHGGSLANLTALLAARAAASPDAWTEGVDGTLAALAPGSAHYSVKRSVAMLGLGERSLIPLEVDEYERILPERLRLVAQGRCQLSSTEVHGERWLRMTVMAPATDERTVEALLDAIERGGDLVRAESRGGHPPGERKRLRIEA